LVRYGVEATVAFSSHGTTLQFNGRMMGEVTEIGATGVIAPYHRSQLGESVMTFTSPCSNMPAWSSCFGVVGCRMIEPTLEIQLSAERGIPVRCRLRGCLVVKRSHLDLVAPSLSSPTAYFEWTLDNLPDGVLVGDVSEMTLSAVIAALAADPQATAHASSCGERVLLQKARLAINTCRHQAAAGGDARFYPPGLSVVIDQGTCNLADIDTQEPREIKGTLGIRTPPEGTVADDRIEGTLQFTTQVNLGSVALQSKWSPSIGPTAHILCDLTPSSTRSCILFGPEQNACVIGLRSFECTSFHITWHPARSITVSTQSLLAPPWLVGTLAPHQVEDPEHFLSATYFEVWFDWGLRGGDMLCITGDSVRGERTGRIATAVTEAVRLTIAQHLRLLHSQVRIIQEVRTTLTAQLDQCNTGLRSLDEGKCRIVTQVTVLQRALDEAALLYEDIMRSWDEIRHRCPLPPSAMPSDVQSMRCQTLSTAVAHRRDVVTDAMEQCAALFAECSGFKKCIHDTQSNDAERSRIQSLLQCHEELLRRAEADLNKVQQLAKNIRVAFFVTKVQFEGVTRCQGAGEPQLVLTVSGTALKSPFFSSFGFSKGTLTHEELCIGIAYHAREITRLVLVAFDGGEE